MCVDVALIAMDDAQRVGGDHGELVIGQIDDLVGVADERRGVAGDEVLVVAHADHQRAAEPGGDDHIGIIAEHDRQAVGAAKLGERGLHGSTSGAYWSATDAWRCRFGVRPAGVEFGLAIRWAMTSVSVADLQ